MLFTPEHEEQAYNSCNGILHMCTNKSRLLVEHVSQICVESNACRYSYFKKVLSNEEDGVSQENSSSEALPEHQNLRGKEEFR